MLSDVELRSANKRAIIIEAGRARKIRSFGPADISGIERTERVDGSGDLTFARRGYKDSDGQQRSEDTRFVGIPDVRSVEKLLREVLQGRAEPV